MISSPEKSPPLAPAPTARYIMIGGFLGAGKTTAIARLARHLAGQGWRVGLITNDQGQTLVDTAVLRGLGFATEEIPGGCFCCRFNSLLEAARKLSASNRPEVFLAEPVGSCTDLVATVSYPLRRLYADRFRIAPLSVLVDPVRAERILGLAPAPGFSEKVLYIYRKQLEEADVIVINKCDSLPEARLVPLREALQSAFPGKESFTVSARHGTNLDPWFARLTQTEQAQRSTMTVDYQTYAEGEAQLGWLNGTVQLSAPGGIDGDGFLQALATAVQTRLQSQHAEVAHLKMTLNPEPSLGELGVVNLVRNDFVPELSSRLEEPVHCGQLIVNLRAEAAPEALAAVFRESLAATAAACRGLQWSLDHLEHFRPAKPVPTHR